MFSYGLILLFLLDFTTGNTIHLYGADPRGGLWGAKVNLTKASGINAILEFDRLSLVEESIDIAAYDHATKSVLLQTSYEATSSLYYGPVCHEVTAPKFLTELEAVPLNDDQLGDCVNCETSGYALHNGKLYFLLYGEFFSSDTISRLVQIRVFEACGECGATGEKSQFEFTFHDMIECSSVVTEILREQFTFMDYDDMEVKGGNTMKVVQHGDHLSFFFLLGNITRFDQGHDKVSLSLWYADDKDHKKELHTEELRSEMAGWDIKTLGSLDYSHHTLCWSAGDRLLCGEYSNHHLHHQMVLMTPLEAATSGVCYKSSAETIRISGVAITRSKDKQVVIFGCHPEDPLKGGTGIIYFSEGYKHIRGVESGSGPLLAGGVFIDRDLDMECPSSLDLDVCLGQVQKGSEDDHTGHSGHTGPTDHLHLDLGHSEHEGHPEESLDTKNPESPKHKPENPEDAIKPETGNPDRIKTDTKLDIDEDDDNNDDDDDDDDVYDDNEMDLDKDYKYFYKTEELIMDGGAGGVSTLYPTQVLHVLSVAAIILL